MHSINCTNKVIKLDSPQVMGIINVSPDSFSSVGRSQNITEILKIVEAMQNAGVAIVDIGGEATNPKLDPVVSLETELARVVPVVTAIRKEFTIPISVDTSKPEVMRSVVAAGANIINDVRALRLEGALETVAQLQVPVCLMHMTYPFGQPQPADHLHSPDIVAEVISFLKTRMELCMQHGIRRENIILDPGIGAGNFGKSTSENCRLLQHLPKIVALGQPVLIGVSRKTFIGDILNQPTEQRLYGSISAATLAVANGAAIIRCHDYQETLDAIKIAQHILKEK